MSGGTALSIGAFADAAGVGVETVRVYERRGLLPRPPRSPSGYGNTPPAVERLHFIRRSQGLGFHDLADAGFIYPRTDAIDTITHTC